MKNITLSLKITTVFILLSFFTVITLFIIFSSLLEDYTLKTEKEKVSLIAETIEPLVAMNAYLDLSEQSENLIKQVAERKNVLGGLLAINDKTIWEKKYVGTLDFFNIDYPVTDPITNEKIGIIHIIYSMEEFNRTVDKMRQDVMYYLGLMSVLFLLFVLFIRYLLNPLELIAKKIKDYKLGEQLDFSNIRMEPETEAMRDAFTLMVDNVREYTTLLEQYKLSVDESSIVTKLNPDGTLNYVNDEFIRVSGYSRNELIGSRCKIMLHPDEKPELLEDIWNTLTAKKIWKGVVKNQSKDGNGYYVNSTMVPLTDENRNIIEYISIQHDITKVIEQSEKIENQTTDQLTGLPNRIKLNEDVYSCKNLIFALFSLDNYDIIKNYYGYESASRTMKELATMLNDLLKTKDIKVYRLSGGEFGFLSTKNIDLDWFRITCQFIIEKTEKFQIIVNSDSIDLRASIGFTSNKENHLSYSGLALRHAIDSKKSLIYYEDQENLISLHESNLVWTKKIKKALAEDRITLFAQPLVETKTMEVSKYECLVRLIDEDGKYVSPFHFLDVAKKTKLYHSITQQVISLSFEVFSQIPEKQFSINISAEDILHKETVDFLESQIKSYNIGNRLILEIVESEGIDSFDEIIDFITAMKALGCTIAIDDFGTGYSNFSYLMKLKVDYIKVDGSLIKDIDHDPNSQIICETILSFSKALDMHTVAEFVHSEAVLDYVKHLGFDYLQGYHLGEPSPIQNLLK